MSAEEKLKRDIRKEAMTRLEEAALSQAEFEHVLFEWGRIEDNKARNDRRNTTLRSEELLNWETSGDTIFPAPMHHMSWRQIMRGDFLDIIFDCPFDLHELTSSRSASEFVKALNDNQKEVLFYKVIRLYSIQRIARLRGQTDRNILKVYTTLIDGIRRKLFERLFPRWKKSEPLTHSQKAFIAWYIECDRDKEKATIDGDTKK